MFVLKKGWKDEKENVSGYRLNLRKVEDAGT
jgi:hypothetical protein